MNKLTSILTAVLLMAVPTCQAETVTIGTNCIALAFAPEESRVFDTNRIACEFTRYFASGNSVESFFGEEAGSLPPGESVQIDPGFHAGGMPADAAVDVVYYSSPTGKIVLGETALTWILGQFDLAAPYTNAWSQLDSLFSELADGSITNDLSHCRETFVVNGDIRTDSSDDGEMIRGIRTYWSKLRFHPPTVFGFRRGRLVEGGAERVGLHCRYSEPDQSPWSRPTCVFVHLEGRWRIVLE